MKNWNFIVNNFASQFHLNSNLHKGQEGLFSVHFSRHSLWNLCLHSVLHMVWPELHYNHTSFNFPKTYRTLGFDSAHDMPEFGNVFGLGELLEQEVDGLEELL